MEKESKDIKIEELNLTNRTITSLRLIGIYTPQELTKYTEQQLIDMWRRRRCNKIN